MEQSSEPMVAVNDPESILERIDYEWWAGKLCMFPNENCTGPKPLRTVFDICQACMSRGRNADPSYSDHGVGMKELLADADTGELPFESNPVAQGEITKKSLPTIRP